MMLPGSRWPALPYTLPFVAFLFMLAIRGVLPGDHEYAIRTGAVALILVAVSPGVTALRPRRAMGSIAVGVAVFMAWVAPDLIWPGYRNHWLFSNDLTGIAKSTLPENVRGNFSYLASRIAGSVLLVPVIEELFWRAWLMRFLISHDFRSVPLGTYGFVSFWVTAFLFASEHGPYWDVGLLAGIVYGWWMIRTKSLADCIVAHAVTNLSLAAYVIAGSHWKYWL